PPVEFTVTCTYGDKTVNVSQFNSYVERTIAIPDGVDPNKITTGIVVEPDGATRHVPTQIVQIDGKYYAKINSLTNSTYSVIWHPLEFKDVAHHWAKAAVNDMGSRMVISGTGQDTFEPDRDITRAEFAAVIVRALGLKPGTGSGQFKDVSDTAWYGDFVKTASENHIISGYGNGQFGPNDQVTREQAFAMIARSMDITGLKAELAAGEADKLLNKYSDANQVAVYAQNSSAACVKTAVISGRNGNLLTPKDNITRAEAAVIVQKLLQKSNLI
ncbi:MAG: S-layer homology domain-containing protein, partial [Syntrophomonas sp.]